MMTRTTITPCLWFDGQAEEAAHFYVAIFPNSRVTAVTHYGEAGREIHSQPPGRVMVAAFELDGQPFTALNGGPLFTFSAAVSFQVSCDSQADIDYYWERLGDGGDAAARQRPRHARHVGHAEAGLARARSRGRPVRFL